MTEPTRSPTNPTSPVESLAQARAFIDPIAAERAARGAHLPPEHLEAAAALLTDLWQAAAAHGITADQPGHTLHLPRAALDTITAAHKRRAGRGA
jgi:hypothetical protein